MTSKKPACTRCLSFFILHFSFFVLLASCAPAPRLLSQPPEEKSVNLWAGEWEEHWPDSSIEDHFRVTLTPDGYTIKVEPLTNADKQRITQLKWDGSLLSFTNMADYEPLLYQLKLDDSGMLINGLVASPEGQLKDITWVKVLPSKSRQDWSGDYAESWPDRPLDDLYRIRVSTDGQRITLSALSNIDRQKIEKMQWGDTQLRFTLHYDQNVMLYQLRQINPMILTGKILLKDGTWRKVTWKKVSTLVPKPAELTPSTWNGQWREYWPGRADNDLYEIRNARAKSAVVLPLTSPDRQKIKQIAFDGKKLHFQLLFDGQLIEYHLALEDPATIRGIVKLPGGKTHPIVWLRH